MTDWPHNAYSIARFFSNVNRFLKKIIFFLISQKACLFDENVKSPLALRTANGVRAGDARKAQSGFAGGTFAENMGLSVANAQIKAARGTAKRGERAAKGGVFSASRDKVARKKAKEGVPKEDQVQKGKKDPEHPMGAKDPAKENTQKRQA